MTSSKGPQGLLITMKNYPPLGRCVTQKEPHMILLYRSNHSEWFNVKCIREKCTASDFFTVVVIGTRVCDF